MASQDTTTKTVKKPAPTRGSTLSRLYTGTGAFDIVGKRKVWYIAFGALVLICLLSIVLRGFNLGIDFTGGTKIQFSATGATGPISTQQVSDVYQRTIGEEPASVQTAGGTGASATIQLRSEPLDQARTIALKDALNQEFQPLGPPDGRPSAQAISDSAVSGIWGGRSPARRSSRSRCSWCWSRCSWRSTSNVRWPSRRSWRSSTT